MDKRIIGLGLIAGLTGGVAAFGTARWNVTPAIANAIQYEEGRSAAEAALTGEHEHGHELFSRALQENVGAGVATIAFGIVIGALFAVAFAMVWAALRRRGAATARGTAMALSAAGFVAVCLVPFLVYPASPPGVGDHDTMAARTTAYLTVLLLSVGLAVAAFVLASRLVAAIGAFYAALAGVGGYLVAVGVVAALSPSYVETPGPLTDGRGTMVFPGFPADVLADFRIYSVLSQLALWLVIGVVFAALIPRVLAGHAAPTDRVATLAV
ncbi:MAG: CbtA family protein [Mycobacterium sp.]|nr:CbtA family protein [Mycobacterium sp.]